MNRDEQQGTSRIHERARQLIAASRVEGISASDRAWLDTHLETCARCAQDASATAAAIESFRAIPVLASDEMVRRTRMAVSLRAEELRIQRARAVPLWIAVAISAAWMLLTTPYTWRVFASLGHATRVQDPVWQVAFLMWWFLPATVLAAIVAWRSQEAVHANWGQS